MDLAAKQPPPPPSETISTPKPKLSSGGGGGCDAFSNGALKRQLQPGSPAASLYRECLKNHAASLGGHALDGCGEFMPSPLSTPSDPTSLKCAACGCHRNFHRRDDDAGNSAGSDDYPLNGAGDVTPKRRSSSSASPPPPPPPPAAHPPISSSYFPASAPQMLLALSTGALAGGPAAHHHLHHHHHSSAGPLAARKRFRTKFSREQKERMYLFAEKLGWKMQKQDERVVEDFCTEIGVSKGVLKVWMHNNKHTFAKKDPNSAAATTMNNNNNNNNSATSSDNNNNHNTTSTDDMNNHNDNSDNNNGNGNGGGGGGIDLKNNGSHLFNGSSSSS